MVPDSCGVYGTFYVDLTGGGLKTFHSPARCPRMPRCSLQGETLRISQAVAKTTLREEGQALPWKQALPSQPRMGVHKDSWEKNNKRGKGRTMIIRDGKSTHIIHTNRWTGTHI